MDAAQALADLTEVSSQIEVAVLADSGGAVLGATTADEAKAKALASAAAELLRASEGVGRSGLVQLQAATPAGSVLLVREGARLVAAVTGPKPTVGLVFYDLKTCLRLIAEAEADDGGRPTGEPAREAAGGGT